ncbi:2Fe-2S ferredoxin-type iron-sulfur binding domain protein [Acididesulfobacillus acetoxydans]|uniref:2Fe-2S ferredoxin-type iron-sulfur binding domain protein n=1 Tax=Acididesulfobacillus acetoxydans TaxID=1561005 RepID=A0A8S0X4H8_9FIRM|nr:ASKHA domain-containing protein [Acididesulfobacillus acetoxydans]CAA7600780.1 2Fe-2S ferredoxin-type iron-sulfur binding domain protein [Acididesulfobacillus acetoxydans]CEJ08628.1 2Fe-2S iron-sulfur cluster binding domain protein [Acididesulfobacillus acetoxydans]
MVEVRFLPADKTIRIQEGMSILQAAIAAEVRVESTCGGKGTCGKCKVRLQTGKIGNAEDLTPAEKKFLTPAEIESGWVLACQHILTEDTFVVLEEQKDAFDRKAGMRDSEKAWEHAPAIRKVALALDPPTVEEQTADWERLSRALPVDHVAFSRLVAASLPQKLRQGKFKVTAVLDGAKLLAVEPGDTISRSFGLAIDIGTTTVVAYLVDLNRGTVIGSGAVTNPQNVFGADVISRITYAAGGPEKLRELQAKVVGGINGVITQLTEKHGVGFDEIYQAVVVGNTTMSHLFLGIDPTFLAPAPFIPVFQQEVEIESRELGLKILPTAVVTVLPNVAGYVGSDTVGVMLAGNADRLPGLNLMVDIGTNGEIILAGKGSILTCSTAAGPAFEGAEIKHGMRAAEGAIERVRIASDVFVEVIGGTKARGICGSGLIDAMAEMVRAGVVETSGRLVTKEAQLEKLPPLVQKRLRGGTEFVLVWAEDSATGGDIVISQKDVRELQLAKGAIMAGIRILLREAGAEAGDIDKVLLAGAFGNYIGKESALGIGLLPSVPLERIAAIGNAAGDGAKIALLSLPEKERAFRLARQAKHIELSTDPDFQEEFINALSF